MYRMGFFFFFGGVGPRNKRAEHPSKHLLGLLKKKPKGYCMECKEMKPLDVFQQDYWFNAFMIPIFRVRRGPQYLGCDICEQPTLEDIKSECRHCHTPVGSGMNFCPNCGARQ